MNSSILCLSIEYIMHQTTQSNIQERVDRAERERRKRKKGTLLKHECNFRLHMNLILMSFPSNDATTTHYPCVVVIVINLLIFTKKEDRNTDYRSQITFS